MKKIIGSLLMLLTFCVVSAQVRVTGRVVDENNEALIGANVVLQGEGGGTVTDVNGKFEIEIPPKFPVVLKVSYVGYETLLYKLSDGSKKEHEIVLKESSILGEEVIVTSTRVSEKYPVAHTDIKSSQIAKSNLGQDLPMLIDFTPSVVTTSDAGAGIGYSGIRVRGSDATRVNITVNGVPINDSESQGVWWVNMPDISSTVEDIQIQRGVGTSTNGAGAFGASINLRTDRMNKKPYGEFSVSGGSFGSHKETVKFSTGVIKKKFEISGRLSNIGSDGYIDRATSDLKSYFLTTNYRHKNHFLKLVAFGGKEKTYQAWNGVPKVRLENDKEGMKRYLDHWLYSEDEYNHMLNSDSRTYNKYTYDNETDNYQQYHHQLHYSNQLKEGLVFNLSFHYTRGRGYYEQYKANDKLKKYGITPTVIDSEGKLIEKSDIIRQKWLDNHFYGTVFSLIHKREKINLTFGGAFNQYKGDHFGEVVSGDFIDPKYKGFKWYESDGVKKDANVYLKTNANLFDALNLMIDLQGRYVNHEIDGIDDDLRNIANNYDKFFFNPKLGLYYDINSKMGVYSSFGVANREPSRSNFTDANPKLAKPTSERLYNLEGGYNFKSSSLAFNVNLFYMNYKDQLVLTGQINDVGNAIMVNVPDSYRAGVEFAGAWQIVRNLKFNANVTLSKNKIENFTEYVDDWGDGITRELGTTDIAFSPELVAGSQLEYYPIKTLSLAFHTKYVGEQYIDNTSNKDQTLDAYLVNDILISWKLPIKKIKHVELNAKVNNVFNHKYETNAWVYKYNYGGKDYIMDGYFPQAGINFLIGAKVKF